MKTTTVVISFLFVSSMLLAQQSKETKKSIFQDNFTNISAWELYTAEGASVKSSSSKNNNVSTLKIEYDLGNKDWVAIEKPVKLILSDNHILKFKISSTGKNNYLETKFVDKDGSVFGNKMTLSADGKWQDVAIGIDEFDYWWGGDDKLNSVVRLGFAISKNDGGKGVVEISDLEIVEVAAKTKRMSADMLDDFESKGRWAVFTSENAKLALKNLPGKENNSLVAEYDLGVGEGRWVAFEKRFKLDFSKNKTLRFWVKAEGEINRLEFKVIDEDGSVFGVRYEDLINKWEEIKIPVNELEYWWGGDDKLTKPSKIGFAISTIDGGKGKIWLDNLRLTK